MPKTMIVSGDVVLVCKKCGKRYLFNNPSLWKGAFERNFPNVVWRDDDEVFFCRDFSSNCCKRDDKGEKLLVGDFNCDSCKEE